MSEPIVDRTLPFVDAHHHVTEPTKLRYDWLTEEGAIYTDLLGDYKVARADWPMWRLLREFHGSNVVKSVHIEASYDGPDPVDETRYLDTVAAAHGLPNAFVVLVDMLSDTGATQIDAHLAASDRVRGVRIRQHPEGGGGPTFVANLRRLAELDLSFELRAWPGPLRDARRSAEAAPSTAFVVGNAGMPLERGNDYRKRWRTEMAALAELPNVHVKVSGLGMADHRWTIDSIRPYVEACLELFGPERTMFGSNWPVDVVYSSYIDTIDAYRRLIVEYGLSLEDQGRVLAKNAEAFYRI
ncbi:MAG: amidohydrolase family protein [Candidatus Limnocylindrales bacterium]